MAADPLAAAEEVAGRDDVRVVVLRGAGKAFCFGGDVAFMAGYSTADLTPDGGMTWTLPRKVGVARATDMLRRRAPPWRSRPST